jgi:hypothetical protein
MGKKFLEIQILNLEVWEILSIVEKRATLLSFLEGITEPVNWERIPIRCFTGSPNEESCPEVMVFLDNPGRIAPEIKAVVEREMGNKFCSLLNRSPGTVKVNVGVPIELLRDPYGCP